MMMVMMVMVRANSKSSLHILTDSVILYIYLWLNCHYKPKTEIQITIHRINSILLYSKSRVYIFSRIYSLSYKTSTVGMTWNSKCTVYAPDIQIVFFSNECNICSDFWNICGFIIKRWEFFLDWLECFVQWIHAMKLWFSRDSLKNTYHHFILNMWITKHFTFTRFILPSYSSYTIYDYLLICISYEKFWCLYMYSCTPKIAFE